MRIHITKYLDCHELEQETGIRLRNCLFTEMVEDGSMIWLDCSDDRISDFEEEIEGFENNPESCGCWTHKLCINELALIRHIRKNSRETDGVYIHYYW